MSEKVEATILVHPDVAALLQDPRNRDSLGDLLAHELWPHRFPDTFAQEWEALRLSMQGLFTDQEIDAELAAHKAERSQRHAAE